MKLFRIVLIIVFLSLWATLSVSAEIYRWKNSNGQMHYSTSPPSRDVMGPIEIKRNGRWYPYTGDDGPDGPKMDKRAPVTYTTSSPGHSLRPTVKPPEQIIVPYNKQATMIIVEVTINRKISTSFAVDTGATFTAISQEIANALHLRPNPKIPPIIVQTANGRIEVPLVKLDSVAVGGLEVPNLTAGIHQFEKTSHISGLLGLNFLKHFQMTVDANNNQLILKPMESLSQYKTRDCVAAREVFQDGQKRHDGSEQEASYYRKAISLCPDFIEAYYHLGAIYIRQQDAERAVDLHVKIVQMQPNEAEAHFRLGVSYMLARKFPQAKLEFQKALQLNPEHKQAQEYLEYLKNS